MSSFFFGPKIDSECLSARCRLAADSQMDDLERDRLRIAFVVYGGMIILSCHDQEVDLEIKRLKKKQDRQDLRQAQGHFPRLICFSKVEMACHEKRKGASTLVECP